MKKNNPKGKVRLTGGTHSRRPVHFSAFDSLRPSKDIVRESVFNWLGQSLQGDCVLDLYAGTGIWSFEALSRGASRAVAVDNARISCQDMKHNAQHFGFESRFLTYQSDVFRFFTQYPADGFNLVIIDPPFAYEAAIYDRLLLAVKNYLTVKDALVYLEYPAALKQSPVLPESLELKRKIYGASSSVLWKLTD